MGSDLIARVRDRVEHRRTDNVQPECVARANATVQSGAVSGWAQRFDCRYGLYGPRRDGRVAGWRTNPRGILGATLFGSNFTSWRIQGNAGGEKNIEPVRGPMNEGGLYGERFGWHLPGYQAPSTSGSDSPLGGVPGAEGRFYTTTSQLDLDADPGVPIDLQLGAPDNTSAVVQTFMNGYRFGHYLPHLGPRTLFPFPPSVINNRGENTLTISLWALADKGARLNQVDLVACGAYRTGFNFNQDWASLQPRWKDNRAQYA